MRKLLSLAAAVAMFAAPSVASAAANVWFALSGSDNGAATAAGGEGSALTITPNGATSLTLTMWINNLGGEGNGNVAAHSSTLSSDFAVTASSFNSTNPVFNLPVAGAGASGPGVILPNFGGGALFNPGQVPGSAAAGTLTLSLVGDALGNIFMDVGSQRWVDSGVPAEGVDVSFGPNAPVDGGVALADGGPLAVITIVPEPASLALMGLGLACLLRRRR